MPKCERCGEKEALARHPTTYETIYQPCEKCQIIILEEKKLQQRKQRSEQDLIEIPKIYRQSDESRFPKCWEKVKNWNGGHLLIYGGTGQCKTRMVCAIAKKIFIEKAIRPVFVTSGQLARLVRSRFDDEVKRTARKRLEEISNGKLLIWDDIGKQANTPAVEEATFELLETRVSWGLDTLATSNATGDTMESGMSADRGTPFVRRVREFFELIQSQ